MFFEGLPLPHLGATILLRGGSKADLAKLKQVFSTLIFSSYNWRLEKSFLMDEFAQPPKTDEFFADGSSKESSPDFHVNKEITEQQSEQKNAHSEDEQKKLESSFHARKESKEKNKVATDEKLLKLPIESIEDFSDPLHLYLTVDDEILRANNSQQFSVAEVPFSNKFRKALDDTILTVSPYLTFSIPYLETDVGRKCKLRLFFPDEIYYSEQFLLRSENDKSSNKSNGREWVENPEAKLLNEKV